MTPSLRGWRTKVALNRVQRRGSPVVRRPAAGGGQRRSAADEHRRAILRNEPCPRKALAAAAAAGGFSLATLSRVIDRDEGYLPRFVREGCPLALAPDHHETLAAFMGIDVAKLGIRNLWRAAA